MSGTVKCWDLRLLERIAEERRKSRPVEAFGTRLQAIAHSEAGDMISRNAGILTQEASNILLEPSQPMIAIFSGPVDSRTCPLCAALVGQRVRTDSPEYRIYSPPLHINCRHYWLYMHPDTPGAREDFTPPDPELVEQFGHFVRRPLDYVELKVPARPTGRDFVVRRYADRTEIEFVPHAEISPRARKVLVELVQRSRRGAWRLPVDELLALMRDQRTGLAELENWGLIRVVTRPGKEQVTFFVARSERDLRERLRSLPEWKRRRIVSIEDIGPAGHGLGAGLRQYRIVYRDLNQAEVQITRYGRLEAAGIHTPAGPRAFKVRWPAGWTELEEEDRVALIASRRFRGRWRYDRPPRIEFNFEKVRARGWDGMYDPRSHTITVGRARDYQRLYAYERPQADARLRLRHVLLHEAGHAAQVDEDWYSEPINEAIARTLSLALRPEEMKRYRQVFLHPFWGSYDSAVRWILTLVPRQRAIELLSACSQAELLQEVRAGLEQLVEKARAPRRAVDLLSRHIHRGFSGDQGEKALGLLRSIADRAGMDELSDGQARSILIEAARGMRIRLGWE